MLKGLHENLGMKTVSQKPLLASLHRPEPRLMLRAPGKSVMRPMLRVPGKSVMRPMLLAPHHGAALTPMKQVTHGLGIGVHSATRSSHRRQASQDSRSQIQRCGLMLEGMQQVVREFPRRQNLIGFQRWGKSFPAFLPKQIGLPSWALRT